MLSLDLATPEVRVGGQTEACGVNEALKAHPPAHYLCGGASNATDVKS